MSGWRNWQTRTVEGRVGQPVGVQVPPSTPKLKSYINFKNQAQEYKLRLIFCLNLLTYFAFNEELMKVIIGILSSFC